MKADHVVRVKVLDVRAPKVVVKVAAKVVMRDVYVQEAKGNIRVLSHVMSVMYAWITGWIVKALVKARVKHV